MRAISRFTLLLCALCMLAPTGLPAAQRAEGLLPGKVTRVIDGDTIDVLLSSGRIRVRLQGIDAPERDQPGGREAAQWLQQRLMNQSVRLEPVSQDRYERMVAIVHAEDGVVNEALLRAGHAWAYRHYLRRADRRYCDLESAARAARLGLWATVMPHAPWQHRQTAGHGPFSDFSQETAGDCRRVAGR